MAPPRKGLQGTNCHERTNLQGRIQSVSAIAGDSTLRHIHAMALLHNAHTCTMHTHGRQRSTIPRYFLRGSNDGYNSARIPHNLFIKISVLGYPVVHLLVRTSSQPFRHVAAATKNAECGGVHIVAAPLQMKGRIRLAVWKHSVSRTSPDAPVPRLVQPLKHSEMRRCLI
jgi:hypothetical protein